MFFFSNRYVIELKTYLKLIKKRFIAIVNPLKSATSFSLQSTRKIRRVIIVLVLFACLTYSYSLFLYDTEPKLAYESEESAKEVCGPASRYKKIVIMLDNTVDSFLTMIVPAIGILFMNFSICRSLSKYNKENIFYSAVNTNSDNIGKLLDDFIFLFCFKLIT